MGRSRRPAAERREQILTTARALFAERGYDAVVMDDIAQACQLARPTLYEYFKSREEILLGLVEQVMELAPEVERSEGSCQEQLERFAAAELAFIQEHREVYRLLFQKLPGLSGPVAERISARQRAHGTRLLALFKQGVASGECRADLEPRDGVFLFTALLGQMGQGVLLSERAIDPEAEAARLVRLAWTGVGRTGRR
jgi:AcrR family transcriptional regulator